MESGVWSVECGGREVAATWHMSRSHVLTIINMFMKLCPLFASMLLLCNKASGYYGSLSWLRPIHSNRFKNADFRLCMSTESSILQDGVSGMYSGTNLSPQLL